MKTEQDVQNLIRAALSPIAVVFRINTGKVKTADGRYFSSGTPKGFSDLTGYRLSDAKIFFIEVKNEKGRLSKDQKHFLETMRKNGAIAGVARSPQQAIDIVQEKDKNNE